MRDAWKPNHQLCCGWVVHFEVLDEFFGGDMNPDDEESYDDDGNLMEPYIEQMMIDSFVNLTGGRIDYLLKIPIFKEYYDSKS